VLSDPLTVQNKGRCTTGISGNHDGETLLGIKGKPVHIDELRSISGN
jgi:hypothetical protein